MGNKLTRRQDDDHVPTTGSSNAKYQRLNSNAKNYQSYHTPTPFSNNEIKDMYCKIIEEDNLLNQQQYTKTIKSKLSVFATANNDF